MRGINRSRRVDAICAARSWKRLSIHDSVNCQSLEQNEKINGSIDFLSNILLCPPRKCPRRKCRQINVNYFFYTNTKYFLHPRHPFLLSGITITFFIELSKRIWIFVIFRFFSWKLHREERYFSLLPEKSRKWVKSAQKSTISDHNFNEK